MQTVDYVLPRDYLLRSIPDFPYLDLVPGMPKLRHIGQKTSVRLRRFQSLRKSGFAVPTFSEVWLPRGTVADDRTGLSGTGRSREVAARRFGYIASFGYQSQITLRRASLAQGRPLTFHFSLSTNPFSLLNNHFSLLTAALAA
jgi:hypothetical protein